jgi:hypothetical protein
MGKINHTVRQIVLILPFINTFFFARTKWIGRIYITKESLCLHFTHYRAEKITLVYFLKTSMYIVVPLYSLLP